MNEEYILKRLAAASKAPDASRARHLEMLKAWTGVEQFEKNDREVAVWYEENRKVVADKVEALKTESTTFEVAKLLREGGKGGLSGVKQVLSMLPAKEREEALKFLSEA